MNKFYIILIGCIFSACIDSSKNKADTVVEQEESKPAKTEPIPIPDYIDKDFVIGNFEPANHNMFSSISSKHTERTGLYLHKEALDAFTKMHAAAKGEGISLSIVSATRNFQYQKGIWQGKWRGERLLEGGINAMRDIDSDFDRAIEILKFSSMPGTSRHHWGTDIDINSFNNTYFKSGKGLEEYSWLVNNAAGFGFYQVYTDKDSDNRTGYEEEKWHWSYMPVALFCQERAKADLKNEDILGFEGSDQAVAIDIVQKYIFGISQQCLNYGTN